MVTLTNSTMYSKDKCLVSWNSLIFHLLNNVIPWSGHQAILKPMVFSGVRKITHLSVFSISYSIKVQVLQKKILFFLQVHYQCF